MQGKEPKHPITWAAGVTGAAGWIYNLLPVRRVIPHAEFVGPFVWALIFTGLWIGVCREWESVRRFHIKYRRSPVVTVTVGILGAFVFMAVWVFWGPQGEAVPLSTPSSNAEPSGASVPTLPTAKLLYIDSARYGLNDKWLDVTDRVRPLVYHQSQLEFVVDDSFLLQNSAEDPRPGTLKKLRISYRIDGVPQQPREWDQKERLRLPLGGNVSGHEIRENVSTVPQPPPPQSGAGDPTPDVHSQIERSTLARGWTLHERNGVYRVYLMFWMDRVADALRPTIDQSDLVLSDDSIPKAIYAAVTASTPKPVLAKTPVGVVPGQQIWQHINHQFDSHETVHWNYELIVGATSTPSPAKVTSQTIKISTLTDTAREAISELDEIVRSAINKRYVAALAKIGRRE